MVPQYEPYIKPEYAEEIKKQVLSGFVGPGKRTEEFEKRFAETVGCFYAIATSSGTASLLVSLLSLGVREGDEVIVPDYSFIAAVNVIRYLKAKPILVDINPKSLCLNPNLLDKAASNRTKALVFINHNGYAADDLIQTRIWCYENKIPMVEDAACAMAQWSPSGIHAGTRGQLGCFSFSAQKFLTTGQGGMIVTNSELLAKKCREWVDQGSITWRKDQLHKNIGLNFKFNDIAAAYGLAQLEYLEVLSSIRYRNFQQFIKNGVPLFSFPQGKPTGPWMNIIRSDEADHIIAKLEKHGYQARKMYRPAHHSLDEPVVCVDSCITEDLWKELVYLPSSLYLTSQQIDEISNIILT